MEKQPKMQANIKFSSGSIKENSPQPNHTEKEGHKCSEQTLFTKQARIPYRHNKQSSGHGMHGGRRNAAAHSHKKLKCGRSTGGHLINNINVGKRPEKAVKLLV